MLLKKSEKNFLYLSVIVHGIFFAILLLLNKISQQDANKGIFEVTTATFVSANKQTAAVKKNGSAMAAQTKVEEKNNQEKSPLNTMPLKTLPPKLNETSIEASDSANSDDQLPTLADENAVTEGVRVLNMKEVTSSLKRTKSAIQNHIEGKIRLKILVDDSGTVRKITSLNSLGYGLDEVAIEAAKKLRFIPARIKTKAVALEAIYTIIFTTSHN